MEYDPIYGPTWLYCGWCSDGMMGNCTCYCPACRRPSDQYIRCQCPRGCTRPVNQTPFPDPDWFYCNQCSPDLTLCVCWCTACGRSKRKASISLVATRSQVIDCCYLALSHPMPRVALGAGPVGHACDCHTSDAEGSSLKTPALTQSICARDRYMLSDTAGTPCVLGTHDTQEML